MTLRPLTIKLVRDLWRLRAQSVAIALVIAAGVGMVVMSFGMIRSLEATRLAYYDRYRFADVFAPVRRAPDSFVTQIRQVPGVAFAEGRVSAGAILDVPGVAEPVTARVHSLPSPGGGLNLLVLRSGRPPAAGAQTEVVVNEAFAKAARLENGERFTALLYGKQVRLRLVGTALSPEYVYAVAPGQIFPDNRRYAIVWMNREPLAGALDLRESFNEALIRLSPNASRDEIIRRLDLLLGRYGATGAYGRDLQISDRFVTNEIDQLSTTVELLPPIFLAVAAFLLNIVLARLVDTEREVIGLMKAFGYSNREVMIHYAELALLLSAGGLALGALLGTWLGRALATMYQQYFVFPFLEFRAGADSYLIGAAATFAAALIGAALAVRRAARLTPAEAMRPPAPADYSGRWTASAARLLPDEPSRMVVRNLLRRPLRTTLAVIGLSAALALYIASASATDNVDAMIDLAFGRAERGDLVVTFAEPRDARAEFELARMPGVMRVEPFRAVGVKLVSGHREAREALSSGTAGADLSRLVDLNGRIVEPSAAGVIVSSQLAKRLAAQPGQSVEAQVTEGERPRASMTVMQVVDTPLGSSARIDRHVLNRIMREGASSSGAYLELDPAFREHVFQSLKNTPQVAAVTSEEAIVQGVRDTVAQQMGIVTLFNTGFAALIVLGVVYNSARISLSEHARDLASMRVLGFRRGETAFVLLGELGVLILLSLPVGIGLGILLSRYVTERFSADLYTIPFGIRAATLAEGALVVMVAAMATALLIRIRVDKLDLVRALKTRE